MTRYNEVKTFIEENHRNPSKHRLEEHDMLNWLKANRKKMNSGAMPEDRVGKFKELLELGVTRGRKLLVKESRNNGEPGGQNKGITEMRKFVIPPQSLAVLVK